MARFGRVLSAMITPFDLHGALNLDAARSLARWLQDQGNDGLVIAGGCNAEGHLAEVVVARLDGNCAAFGPKLPEPRAYAGCFTMGSRLILNGGTTTPTATGAPEIASDWKRSSATTTSAGRSRTIRAKTELRQSSHSR